MALRFSFPNRHYITSKHPQFKASRFNSADLKQHGRYVIELREEFEKQFSIFQLFAEPMAVTTIVDHDPELRMELCKLQSDILFSSKQNLTYGQLWNFVLPDKYPKLHNFALKSKQGNRLSQDALKSNLRIVTAEMEADIVTLVNEHTAHCSH
ncbi:hypothetical protein PR048_009108 [Dryococelus australis]|uniref:Uncharacterized protein n=1 Tax=Dryococelus australis TaxID=614101 RepID=A0ABQ9HZ04_9NEOP|nr:hypothetical protein PR048_009108 [Dryococelus australis]